jgi:NAD(P)-dependent dehydrogenase (short-subunit alcohol dehydrogenase family)
MMKNSKERIAVVTGGSHGIGRMIAERLVAEKFTVIINYNNGKLLRISWLKLSQVLVEWQSQ